MLKLRDFKKSLYIIAVICQADISCRALQMRAGIQKFKQFVWGHVDNTQLSQECDHSIAK